MNQILDTKKIYVTPKMKRRKRLYKINFFISVFLVCLLSSYYIYAEYDKTKSEEVSRKLLDEIEAQTRSQMAESQSGSDDSPILIILDEREFSFVEEPEEVIHEPKDDYDPIATIDIPKLNLSYPILSKTTDELLKISPTKLYGPNPNEVGNFCVVGHNYRNTRFFSKVPTLENGDIIKITDMNGKTVIYKIYSMYEVDPKDSSCTSQKTNGRREVTLITCTNDSKKRVVVKATEI